MMVKGRCGAAAAKCRAREVKERAKHRSPRTSQVTHAQPRRRCFICSHGEQAEIRYTWRHEKKLGERERKMRRENRGGWAMEMGGKEMREWRGRWSFDERGQWESFGRQW